MNYLAQNIWYALAALSIFAPNNAMERPPSPDDLAEQLSTLTLRAKSCLICLETKRPREFVQLPCQHEYCDSCLTATLTIGITDKKLNYLQCPEQSCRQTINVTLAKYVKIISVTPTEELCAKEIIYATIKPCPTKNCSVMFLATTKNRTVSCEKCDQRYCSQCTKEHYYKVTCTKARNELRLALEKHRNDQQEAHDALSRNWITKNTKPCPECHTSILKVDGCQRVRCTKCQTQFQWN